MGLTWDLCCTYVTVKFISLPICIPFTRPQAWIPGALLSKLPIHNLHVSLFPKELITTMILAPDLNLIDSTDSFQDLCNHPGLSLHLKRILLFILLPFILYLLNTRLRYSYDVPGQALSSACVFNSGKRASTWELNVFLCYLWTLWLGWGFARLRALNMTQQAFLLPCLCLARTRFVGALTILTSFLWVCISLYLLLSVRAPPSSSRSQAGQGPT